MTDAALRPEKSESFFRNAVDYIAYLALRAVLGVILLTPWHLNRFVFSRLAGVAYYVDRRHRNIALRNLHLAFGDEMTDARARSITKQVYRNLGYMAADVIFMLKITPETVDEYFDFENEHIVYRARAGNVSGVAMSGHFCSWELLGAHPLKFGDRLAVPAKKIKNPYLWSFVDYHRERFKVEMLPSHGSIESLLKAVDEKRHLGFFIDQRARHKDGVIVEFFGRPVRVIGSVARLALTRDLPVALGLLKRVSHAGRHGKGRYKVVYSDDIPVIKTGDLEADIVVNTQRFMKKLEAAIRDHPEEWFWLHDLWRIRTDAGRVDVDKYLEAPAAPPQAA